MMTKLKTNLIWAVFASMLMLTGLPKINAQHFDFGYEYGASSYFGDLTKYSAIPSTVVSSASKGHYFGYGNKYVTVFLNYTVTEINASDQFASSVNRQARNLSFRSPILEYGLTTEFNLWSLMRKEYTKVQPVLITGVNVFYFNPQTFYNGQWIDLRDLGTEGQGSEFYPDRQKYSLTQLSIPFGAGLKMEVTRNIWIGVGMKLRLTFTDYLDDVSTTYVDPEKLAASNGELAASLAFRGDELNSTANYTEGDARGNPNENDWYMTTYVSMGVRFRENYKPKRKRRNRSRRKIKCPSF